MKKTKNNLLGLTAQSGKRLSDLYDLLVDPGTPETTDLTQRIIKKEIRILFRRTFYLWFKTVILRHKVEV